MRWARAPRGGLARFSPVPSGFAEKVVLEAPRVNYNPPGFIGLFGFGLLDRVIGFPVPVSIAEASFRRAPAGQFPFSQGEERGVKEGKLGRSG